MQVATFPRPELVQMAEMLARDKGIEKSAVLEAMEQGKICIIRMRDMDFDDEVSVDILTSFFIQKICKSVILCKSMRIRIFIY